MVDMEDVPPEKLTEHVAGQIANALEATNLLQIREIQANQVGQVHIILRVPTENEFEVAQKIVDSLLIEIDDKQDPDIKVFLGKQYLRKFDEKIGKKRLAYAWVFSFSAQDLRRMSRVVCEVIEQSIPVSKLDIMEAPLLGQGAPLSTGPGVRGARPLKA